MCVLPFENERTSRKMAFKMSFKNEKNGEKSATHFLNIEIVFFFVALVSRKGQPMAHFSNFEKRLNQGRRVPARPATPSG